MAAVRVEALGGSDLLPHLHALGRLRAAVFRDWPYLYDGDEQSEAEYLSVYVESRRAAVFVAMDGHEPVGLCSCIPLEDEQPEVIAPFAAHGVAAERVFYFGESVLLPPYRGQGIGVRFFEARELHARGASDCDFAAFCAVQRPADHPARPPGAAPLDAFWRRRGYTHRPDLACTMRWREIGGADETEHRLAFWLKSLTGAALP